MKLKNDTKKRYSNIQLKMALDLIEAGSSFSEVEDITQVSKSILAREIRKRKNLKAEAKHEEYVRMLQGLDRDGVIN